MGNNYSNRNLIVEVAVGSILFGALEFFIWDELPPGYSRAFVVLGAAFMIGILRFVWREMTGKQLVITSAIYAMLILGFGSITWVVFNAVLDAALKCPRGEFLTRPDGLNYRTVPHFHRRKFDCVRCTNPHLSIDDDGANQPEQTYR